MKVCVQLVIIRLRDAYLDILILVSDFMQFSVLIGWILPLQYLDYGKSQMVLQPILLFNKYGTQDSGQLQKHAKYQKISTLALVTKFTKKNMQSYLLG